MTTAASTFGNDLAQAVREEGVGWRRPAPLLAGLALFGLSALFLRAQPAWALSLGLWAGHAAADGLSGLLARRTGPQARALLPALLLAILLTGAALGWSVEQALLHDSMAAADRLTRFWLHLSFNAALLGLPLLQGLRRLRAVRRVEADRARLRAELQMLQAQIEPHFLFNTLATLRSFIRQGSNQSLPLLDAISGLFDVALTRARQTETTLGEECQLVEHYLAIMALRLGGRLRYRIDVEASLQHLPLPPLILQPLIENAIQHGIEPSEAGGEVLLWAARDGDRLELGVANSGAPLRRDAEPAGHGMALANLRQRLKALYGDGGRLSLATNARGLTEATLTLPLT
ncbi:sensor histidine kinase [Roseateles sp. BYS96W]|uniref:Sensor histidine kinase n=1 Tax=Pelomonas nitida TaxID=3299027 RepID=A0ABW7GAV6_9BURK